MAQQEHFNNFMVEVEQGYGSGTGKEAMNIYHNRRHAADVTQAVHYFLLVNTLGGGASGGEAKQGKKEGESEGKGWGECYSSGAFTFCELMHWRRGEGGEEKEGGVGVGSGV